MKAFIRNIHLYLSLAAGLVVLVTCLTGAILVFEEELQQAFHHQRYFVKPSGPMLPLQQLVNTVSKQVAKVQVVSVKQYPNNNRTVEIALVPQKPSTKPTKPQKHQADHQRKEGKDRKDNNRIIAFVNPYTAEIVEIYKHQESFFFKVMSLHRWLLAGDTGKLIVGIATLVFLFILISGIVLWWPKNKQMLVQRLRLKVNANYKRLNFDWHVVLGFYASFLLFLFAFTGLAWSFQWFNDGIFWVTQSSKQPAKAPAIERLSNANAVTLDSIVAVAKQFEPSEIRYCQVNVPKDSADCFQVTMLPKRAAHPSATNVYYLNPLTAQLVNCQLFEQRNLGQRVRAAFKPLHVASYFGWVSKLFGFLACLIGTSLPITGVIMWINRLKKQSH